MIKLTIKECKAIIEIVDQLSGGNAENVFSEEDDPEDPVRTAFVKLFEAAGREAP